MIVVSRQTSVYKKNNKRDKKIKIQILPTLYLRSTRVRVYVRQRKNYIHADITCYYFNIIRRVYLPTYNNNNNKIIYIKYITAYIHILP